MTTIILPLIRLAPKSPPVYPKVVGWVKRQRTQQKGFPEFTYSWVDPMDKLHFLLTQSNLEG